MIVVCTRDQAVIDASDKDDAVPWKGCSYVQNQPGGQPLPQAQATMELETLLSNVTGNEDICFSAHGNNTEIGGDGSQNDPWTWTAPDIARILLNRYQQGWRGRVLFHVCCDSVANFSAAVALAVGFSNPNVKIACYGYNRALPANEGIPAPDNLDKNVSLQVTIS